MKRKLILIAIAMATLTPSQIAAAECEKPANPSALLEASGTGSSEIALLQKGLRIRLARNDRNLSDGRFGPVTVVGLMDLCLADVMDQGRDKPMQNAVAIALAYAGLPDDFDNSAGLTIAELVANNNFTSKFADIVLDDILAKPERLAKLAAGWRAPDTTVSNETDDQEKPSEPQNFTNEADMRTALVGALLANPVIRAAMGEAVNNAQVFDLDPDKIRAMGLDPEFSEYVPGLEGAAFTADTQAALKGSVMTVVRSIHGDLAAARVNSAADRFISQFEATVSMPDNGLPPDLQSNADEPTELNLMVTEQITESVTFDSAYRDAIARFQFQPAADPELIKADFIRVLNTVEERRGVEFENTFARKLPDLVRVSYRLTPDIIYSFAFLDIRDQAENDRQAKLAKQAESARNRERDEELRELYEAHGEAMVELRKLRKTLAAIRLLAAK